MTRHRPRGAHSRSAGRVRSALAALFAVLLLALAVICAPRGTAHNTVAAHDTVAASIPHATPAPQRPAAPDTTSVPVRPVPKVPVADTKPLSARPYVSSTSATVLRITLHRGDTLWALSRSHGTTVATLQALNGLGHSTLIYAGRTLLVPATTASPRTPAHRPAVSTPPGHPSASAVDNHVQAPANAAPTGAAAVAVAFAERQLGVPYLWGGTTASGYDCSGLIQAAWRAAGIDLPRTTYDQINAGTRINRDQLRPGDLVFSNGLGHVQLYIGHGTVIEAPHTGATVQYSPLPAPGQVDAYVRVNPAG